MRKRFFLLGFLICVLNVSITFADGIIIPRPRPEELPLPPLAIKYHHVNIEINNQVAKTSIDQVFINPHHRDIEGTYIFPLPEKAAISEFAMFTDGKKIIGEILDKDKARKIYEDIVRGMKDPAILEYIGTNMFKAQVYPIPARGEKRIQLTYAEILKLESGICHYFYPLDTERFSPRSLDSVVITVKITSKLPIKSVYSSTHEIKITKKDDYTVLLSYEENNVKPDKNFELYYTVSKEDIGLNLLTHKEKDEDGFFMVLVSPKQEIKKAIKKDIAFVVDTSGSMADEKIKQAKEALKFCINSLNKDDKFNLISFSTDVERFKPDLIDYTAKSKEEALKFIDNLQASGGTNINDALLSALALKSTNARPYMIVFLTDGLPTVGEQNIKKIVDNIKDANKQKSRVFVFGVGDDVNTHLLDKISSLNKGISEYVRPKEDLEVKVSNFYTKISQPVLSDLKLDFGKIEVKDIYPNVLPDLFKGSQLIILGRYKNSSATTIDLIGDIEGEKHIHHYEGTFQDEISDNEFLPRLWATRKIGYLLDEIRLHGETKELIDEIKTLSKKYGIITPYTSFLVLEDEGGIPQRMLEKSKADFKSMKLMTVGEKAVDSAKELGALKKEEIAAAPTVEIIKYVGKKTFYLRNDVWVDSDFKEGIKTHKIEYGSEGYFKLLADKPSLGKFFALGKKIIVKFEGQWYEVSTK
ncbi:MAG: VIT and VWA domain-containing protein [bacterium]